MTTSQNPWKGLVSYQEEDYAEFKGRAKARNDLFLLITNNLLVTLYGKTGCGKTSLLQAGLFPTLRRKSYLPFIVRLSSCPDDKDYASFIISQIEAYCDSRQVHVRPREKWLAPSALLPDTTLWNYLYGHDFIDGDGLYLFPVIVIDQIEEAFTSPDKMRSLLRQLYNLLSDNLQLPDDVYANFRFVLSIREDDLCLLEDAIEDDNLLLLKQNRYRLSPLTVDNAREIIRLGTPYFMPGKEDEICDKILSISMENNHVSTNMLSLICSELYEHSIPTASPSSPHSTRITLEAVRSFSENPLENYARASMAQLSEKARSFIEDEMVSNKRRKPVSWSDFEQHTTPQERQLLLGGKTKMVQPMNNQRFAELIHDSLAKAITALKDKRQQEATLQEEKLRNEELLRKNRRSKRLQALLGALVVLLVLVVAWLWLVPGGEERQRVKVCIHLSKDSTDNVLASKAWSINISTQADDGSPVVLKTEGGPFSDFDFKYTHPDTTLTLLLDAGEVMQLKHKLRIHVVPYNSQLDSIGDKTVEFTGDTLYNVSIHVRMRSEIRFPIAGRIVQDSAADRSLQNAMVILENQVTRTDAHGNFSFTLPYRPDSASMQNLSLIVLYKYYNRADLSLLDLKRESTIRLTPRTDLDVAFDSLFQQYNFLVECATDSIRRSISARDSVGRGYQLGKIPHYGEDPKKLRRAYKEIGSEKHKIYLVWKSDDRATSNLLVGYEQDANGQTYVLEGIMYKSTGKSGANRVELKRYNRYFSLDYLRGEYNHSTKGLKLEESTK